MIVRSYKIVLGSERASNALRFATEAEAQNYLHELTGRWYGAPQPRAVAESDDPVNSVADASGRVTKAIEV
jgi:hypothetical protein